MNNHMVVLIPAYNEEESIKSIIESTSGVLDKNGIPHSLLFIDDGSMDFTWDVICKESEKRENVGGIRLSRNFGKEGAIFAGLASVKGDCCVVMDCDGQHPPTLLVDMYRKWKDEGYQVVEAVKNSRGRESFIKRMFAGLFYKLISASTGIDMQNASDYKLLDAKVIEALNSMPESQTFFRAMSSWTGFKKTKVGFDVEERANSDSKWSKKALFNYALNAISSYSSLPMQIVTVCGIGFFIFSLGLMIHTLVMKLTGRAVEGFTTVIILLLLIGSIIMFSLGVIGFYISRIYNEIKRRPRYLINERTGSDS